MADESQKSVRLRSAITTAMPGRKAASNSWPTASLLLTSTSTGNVTVASTTCRSPPGSYRSAYTIATPCNPFASHAARVTEGLLRQPACSTLCLLRRWASTEPPLDRGYLPLGHPCCPPCIAGRRQGKPASCCWPTFQLRVVRLRMTHGPQRPRA